MIEKQGGGPNTLLILKVSKVDANKIDEEILTVNGCWYQDPAGLPCPPPTDRVPHHLRFRCHPHPPRRLAAWRVSLRPLDWASPCLAAAGCCPLHLTLVEA